MTTQAELIDTYGDLDIQIKALKKQQDAVRAKLDKFNSKVVEGERFELKRIPFSRATLDKKAVVETLGEAWVSDHSTISNGVRYTIRYIGG